MKEEAQQKQKEVDKNESELIKVRPEDFIDKAEYEALLELVNAKQMAIQEQDSELTKVKTQLEQMTMRHERLGEDFQKLELENTEQRKMNKELQDKLNIMKFNLEELKDQNEVLEEEYHKVKQQQATIQNLIPRNMSNAYLNFAAAGDGSVRQSRASMARNNDLQNFESDFNQRNDQDQYFHQALSPNRSFEEDPQMYG
jgi:chromosome segregation ATPase